jgi:Na+-transporting NADH:ubiquinone oxidoreductase subunit NqrC
MPGIWKVAMVILVLCLVASMVIGTVQLVTTPTETFGGLPLDGQGWRESPLRR